MTTSLQILRLFAIIAALYAAPALAEPPLPMADTAEEVGLSSTQLALVETVTQRHIENGLLPGAAMLVARRGKIAWRVCRRIRLGG